MALVPSGKEPVRISNPNLVDVKKWTRGRKIKEGAFAKVYLATNNETKEVFAVKSVNMIDVEKRLALENERKVLKVCKSPYIVKYLGCAKSTLRRETDKTILLDIFMEYVKGGNVLEHTHQNGGGLEEPIVAAYTRDVLRGLAYLHARGIVHGDVKCANLLIGEDSIKLCDLGSAKVLAQGDLVMPPRPGEKTKRRRIFVTGTPGWMAPEVEDEVMQDLPSDIYSVGCAVVEMCTGEPPNKDPNIYTFDDGDLSECTVDVPPNYSEACRDFVEQCLLLDPTERPEARALLNCAWIKNAPPFPKKFPQRRERAKSVVDTVSGCMGCGPSRS